MEKGNAGLRRLALLALAAIAIASAAIGVGAPALACAGEPDAEGIVISLGEASAHTDGMLVFEVASYRLAESGEVIELDEPFTMTVPDSVS